MTKTTVLGKTSSPAGSVKPATGGGAKTKSPTTVFVSAALDMSWRLAIVVLLPIIGGFELDKHLSTAPWLAIAGFVIAMGGVFVVLKQMLRDVNELPSDIPRKKESHS